MYQVICQQMNYLSNKVSGAESGAHTATLPHGKADPAKESKVHNGGALTPVMIVASLGRFMCGESRLGHGIQGL